MLKEKVEQTEAALGQAHADQDDNRDLDNQRIEQYRVSIISISIIVMIVFRY